MTYLEKGDRVKFIDEVGGGKILKIINKNTVLILDDNGFEYEVEASRLMPEKPQKKKSNINKDETKTSQKQLLTSKKENAHHSIKNIKEPSLQKYEETNIILGFIPVNNNFLISDINLYLVNDSPYKLYYQIAVKKDVAFTSFVDGILEDNTQVLIDTIPRKHLFSIKEILIRGLLTLPSFIEEGKPFEEKIKIKPVKFTKEGSFKKNAYFDTPSILHFIKPIKKYIEFPQNDKKSHLKTDYKVKEDFTKEKIEIDLHIENIEKNYRQLTPDQMLSIQESYFIKILEKAITSNNVKKMIVIHGIGNGTLKTNIRKILRENYSYLKFYDAPFEEYGYGATTIELKK